VPLDVVRKLIKTGTPLSLGVEQRFMTMLFTDLKDFSTLAEQMAPNDLLAQLSVYFEVVSHAIAEEFGTVDKFMDDIMAFWGAPIHRDDHVLPAAARCGRRGEWNSSMRIGASRGGRPCISGLGCIARMCWSAMSAPASG
jgi:adenylate cyclase